MKRLSALLGACLVLALPSPARANGRFPASSALVVSPATDDLLAVRATYGVLISHDHGQTWDWVCEQALGFVGTADPPLTLSQSGAVALAKFDGLQVSPDTGCAWSHAAGALGSAFVADVATRPGNGHAVVAVAQAATLADAGADAGAGFPSQVWQSTDDGATWAPLGSAFAPGWVADTIEVSASDPHRLYVTVSRGTGASREAQLLVSTDDGVTFAASAIPIDPQNEPSAFIGAVDPSDADKVYVRTGGLPNAPSRLLVTTDRGAHFTAALSLKGPMQGFALSVDGADVFAGGPADGLLSAKASDLVFAPRASLHVQCLRATANELWACSDEASGFVVGVSTDEGATFAPRLHLGGLRGALACPTGSTAAQCAPLFDGLCQSLGGCATDAGPPAPKTPSASCGCDVPAGEAGGAGMIGLSGLAAMAWRTRRSSRAQTSQKRA